MSDEICTFPALNTLEMERGVVVKMIDEDMGGPGPTKHGAVSIGPSFMPGVGPVFHIALHTPDEKVMMVTLNMDALRELTLAVNRDIIRIMAGDFDAPPTMQ